jgi:hypothetical protein
MNHPAFGLIGVAVLFGIAIAASSNRRAISPRIVLASFGLQVAIAILVLFVPIGKTALGALAGGFQTLLNYSNEGISFMFVQSRLYLLCPGLTGDRLLRRFDGSALLSQNHAIHRTLGRTVHAVGDGYAAD